jgi:hypothetical protein
VPPAAVAAAAPAAVAAALRPLAWLGSGGGVALRAEAGAAELSPADVVAARRGFQELACLMQ